MAESPLAVVLRKEKNTFQDIENIKKFRHVETINADSRKIYLRIVFDRVGDICEENRTEKYRNIYKVLDAVLAGSEDTCETKIWFKIHVAHDGVLSEQEKMDIDNVVKQFAQRVNKI